MEYTVTCDHCGVVGTYDDYGFAQQVAEDHGAINQGHHASISQQAGQDQSDGDGDGQDDGSWGAQAQGQDDGAGDWQQAQGDDTGAWDQSEYNQGYEPQPEHEPAQAHEHHQG